MTLESKTPILVIGATAFRTLVPRAAKRTEIGHERKIYLEPSINALIDGKSPDSGFPDVTADALVERFIVGYLIQGSLLGTSEQWVDLERLQDMEEVWALCIRKPKPGWRIFGRFMCKDCFVGLLAYDRHALAKRENYHKLALGTIEAWQALFPGTEPHRGQTLGDYLGGVWRDVDEDV